MNLFGAGRENRSTADVCEAQLAAEKADLRRTGRNAVTVADLQAAAAARARRR